MFPLVQDDRINQCGIFNFNRALLSSHSHVGMCLWFSRRTGVPPENPLARRFRQISKDLFISFGGNINIVLQQGGLQETIIEIVISTASFKQDQ